MSEQPTTEELKENVTNTNVWIRLLYMALFSILYWAAEAILGVVIVFQFLFVLLTGSKNDKVLAFGAQLSTYAYQIFRYLTFNSEEQPFPLGEWPNDKPLTEEVTVAEKPKRAPRKPAAKKPATRKTPAKKAAPKAEESTAVDASEDKPAADEATKI